MMLLPSNLERGSVIHNSVAEQERDSCPLCRIPKEEVLAEFQSWKLARTKTMKGHKERLMLFNKEHVRSLDEGSIGEAYMILAQISSKFFLFTDKWAIFEPVYATVPNHWHRVASDLDSNAEDHEQILKTPRLIIHNVKGIIVSVESAAPMSDGSPKPTVSAK